MNKSIVNMSINIELSNENMLYLKYLNNIKVNDKNKFLNYIFNLGFKEYEKLKNSEIDNFEINDSNNLINNIDMILENKTNKLYALINEMKLENNYKNNVHKGMDGENIIFNFFKTNFNNYGIEYTSAIPHSGDFKNIYS